MAENVTKPAAELKERWRGSVLLELHIRSKHRTVIAFCEATGLERTYVSRLIDGDRGNRMPVQMAVQIRDATGGDVPVDSWAETVMAPAPMKASDVPTEADLAALAGPIKVDGCDGANFDATPRPAGNRPSPVP